MISLPIMDRIRSLVTKDISKHLRWTANNGISYARLFTAN